MGIPGGVNTHRAQWESVFSESARHRVLELLDLDEGRIPERVDATSVRESVSGARVIVSSWGAAPLTAELLAACPDLELVVHAGGSIRDLLTDELAGSGVTVCSAVHLNARPVAEFTLGLILMALKDVFRHNERLHTLGERAWVSDKARMNGGYYGTRVGLLGYGRIAEQLLDRLREFDIDVYVNDPHVSDEAITSRGATPASAEWILENCRVVSVHHADTAENRHMIDRDSLALMPPGSHLINTSRGGLVNEEHLAERLLRGDITAYLDVTDPEPPHDGHPFYRLPNCILTPHIAGSIGAEITRMGDYVVREIENWIAGRALENQIDLESVDFRA